MENNINFCSLLGGIGGIGSEFDGQIPQGVDNKFLTGLIAKL